MIGIPRRGLDIVAPVALLALFNFELYPIVTDGIFQKDTFHVADYFYQGIIKNNKKVSV